MIFSLNVKWRMWLDSQYDQPMKDGDDGIRHVAVPIKWQSGEPHYIQHQVIFITRNDIKVGLSAGSKLCVSLSVRCLGSLGVILCWMFRCNPHIIIFWKYWDAIEMKIEQESSNRMF